MYLRVCVRIKGITKFNIYKKAEHNDNGDAPQVVNVLLNFTTREHMCSMGKSKHQDLTEYIERLAQS